MGRYHVRLGKKRTTLSLSPLLSTLLALKLGFLPDSREAHSGVRAWLQDCLDHADDPGRVYVSQWIQDQAVLFLVDNILSHQYDQWLLRQLDEHL